METIYLLFGKVLRLIYQNIIKKHSVKEFFRHKLSFPKSLDLPDVLDEPIAENDD